MRFRLLAKQFAESAKAFDRVSVKAKLLAVPTMNDVTAAFARGQSILQTALQDR